MLKKITLLGATALTAFALNTGEININNKDLEVSGQFDVGQFNEAVEPNTMFVGAKFLNADEKHSDNERVNLDPYFEANFLMMRPIGNQGMRVGMGAKINFTKNFTSVPLGLQFAYKIPANSYVPMYLNGELYYAPSVLSFSDADSFLEYRLSYDIEIIDNGRITLGYRSMDTNYKANKGYSSTGGDFNYNSYWYVGFKVGF
ncbi:MULTISPECIES: YfaZ family outer membrane protein [Sulfurimonas]|uniref:YfaZ family outer membrane protein n=1 Tax=Sulfurimonas TaxID=202746 RepID=UPI001264E06B|nr:YfaZ family outer membrane protein [Sulfurimonas indica]